MPMTKYAKIGESPAEHQPKKTWYATIDDLKTICPRDYFVTTGEAIVKIDYMIGQVKKLLVDAKKLRKNMVKSKSTSKYLETSWEDGILILRRKDSRPKEKPNE
jgi:hypothetical protein